MNYFKSRYNYFIDDERLVVNLLSISIIKLTEDKFKGLKNGDLSFFSEKEIESLAKMSFITDIEDETSYYLENKIIKRDENRLGLTIMTTTACNARCHYCYQEGVEPVTMSDFTKEEIVRFIKDKKPSRLHITWFGGEPLLNANAIDYVCEECEKAGIDFYSTIITNGYLVDKHIASFKDKWRMRSAQITIDGINEKYNNCKRFICNRENAFDVVISNIEKLIENGIGVSVRMNFDKNNYLDILEAIEFIHQRFGNHRKIRIYVNNIYGEPSSYHLDDGTNLYLVLYKKLIDCGYINSMGDFRIYARDRYCFISDDKHFVIGPDGNLFKCEHAILDYETGKVGTIKDGITSQKNYDFWHKMVYPYKECRDCQFWFICQGGCKHQLCFADYKGTQCIWIKEIFDDLIKLYYSRKGGAKSGNC